MCEFGECVQFMRPGKAWTNEFDDNWKSSLWLGISDSTRNTKIGTPEGCFKVTTRVSAWPRVTTAAGLRGDLGAGFCPAEGGPDTASHRVASVSRTVGVLGVGIARPRG